MDGGNARTGLGPSDTAIKSSDQIRDWHATRPIKAGTELHRASDTGLDQVDSKSGSLGPGLRGRLRRASANRVVLELGSRTAWIQCHAADLEDRRTDQARPERSSSLDCPVVNMRKPSSPTPKHRFSASTRKRISPTILAWNAG